MFKIAKKIKQIAVVKMEWNTDDTITLYSTAKEAEDALREIVNPNYDRIQRKVTDEYAEVRWYKYTWQVFGLSDEERQAFYQL